MDKIRVGVIGASRGLSMVNYCLKADNAQVVAICEKRKELIEDIRRQMEGLPVTFYEDYDEFLTHDMDAVVLANYAHQHAPFAVKAMKAGKHVISEVLPCQTMKEAVELVEAVEETGKIYCYAENYCYMRAPYEMHCLYKEGKIGEIEYAEGEYVHNCETIWPDITYGEPDHWRNRLYSTFYCTHSLGPLLFICGLRPVSVTGFELPYGERCARVGRRGGAAGIEMVTLENGAILKSIHGGLMRDSIWYTVYGKKGNLESARETAENGAYGRLYLKAYRESGDYEHYEKTTYEPEWKKDERVKEFGHGGSNYVCMWNCFEKMRGNPEAETVDVYMALDMSLPGIFAYRSILAGNKPMLVPNLRNKEERDAWRNDVACTDPDVAGDSLLPCNAQGDPEIEPEVYELVRKKWEEKGKRNQYKVNK